MSEAGKGGRMNIQSWFESEVSFTNLEMWKIDQTFSKHENVTLNNN